MAARTSAQAAGERIETLLAMLRSDAGPEAAAAAEELVSCLVGLYGAGLSEIVRIIGEDAEAGPRLLDRLAADPVVEGLLLIHDLHPVDAGTRIQRALDRVRPYLGSQKAEYQDIDDQGVVQVRLVSDGHGCLAEPEAARTAIEQAVAQAAPETSGVDIESAPPPPWELPLLQITRRPAVAR